MTTRHGITRRAIAVVVALTALVTAATPLTGQARAADYTQYLDLPLTNRFADVHGGGVNRALPTDVPTLTTLIGQARRSGTSPQRYAALLFQYRLAQATSAAGIDLAKWNPQNGFHTNRKNMIKSYRYYLDLQIAHRELQWAGMAGTVGADFGGGVADVVLAGDIYQFTRLQPVAAQVIEAATSVSSGLINIFPKGFRTLAYSADKITPKDLDWFAKRILVMQKAIFADLMPMHVAYVKDGISGIDEFRKAGIIDDGIRSAWDDVASGNKARIATGNATLLRREQHDVIGWQFDGVRAYRKSDHVGEALTYAMTIAGSPSIAGVPALRNFRPFHYQGTLPDGRSVDVKTPIADWDWSYFDMRWQYVTTELLPRYTNMINNDWKGTVARMRVPYEQQFESHRPIYNLDKILADVAANTVVTVK